MKITTELSLVVVLGWVDRSLLLYWVPKMEILGLKILKFLTFSQISQESRLGFIYLFSQCICLGMSGNSFISYEI